MIHPLFVVVVIAHIFIVTGFEPQKFSVAHNPAGDFIIRQHHRNTVFVHHLNRYLCHLTFRNRFVGSSYFQRIRLF